MKKFIFIIAAIAMQSCLYEDVPRSIIADVDPNLCIDSDLVLILESTQNTSGCGVADGALTVSGSGGVPPYMYSINGGTSQSSNVFGSLLGGTYTVTVYDSKPCSYVLKDVMVENAGSTLSVSATTTDNTSCLSPNGEVQLNATGGDMPYKFSFNGSSLSDVSLYTGVAPGTYEAMVVDANGTGCEAPISVTVLQSSTTDISYETFIAPLITQYCAAATCHGAGNTKPGGDLTTYSLVKANAATIKKRTGDGSMPKRGKLSAEQIKKIACWVDAGAPNN
ncbi:hypothetical protein [Marinoscillum sp. MHG1-6]|uniref:hypothetical protein n=1 Tax=Marinoscillum sp. MHG1-6 TaxID=2959627 RepID=UPI0021570027|nr:hypothetical protein [Marinoscillum sp. MHG1-6]